MYGKFFESTFTGSMMGAGSDVFAVWAYVIANTVGGEIELNPKLLSVLIGASTGAVEKAIDFLCGPDPYSRSQREEGRRLIKNGQFQYHVVNYEDYNKLRKAEERREYLKEKQREHRAVVDSQQVSTVVNPNIHVNPSYSDTNTDTNTIKQSVAKIATDPRIKSLITKFCDLYQQKLNQPYIPNFGKDGVIIKGILAAFNGNGEAEVESLMQVFFKMSDDFIDNAGYSIGVFKSQLSKIQKEKQNQKKWGNNG